MDPAAFLAMGREVLSRQPFSRLLGAELVALEPGRCELAVVLGGELMQQDGFAHGGVVSYSPTTRSPTPAERRWACRS